MTFRKSLFIGIVFIIVGSLLSIYLAISSGSMQYREICNKISVMAPKEAYYQNIYGFDCAKREVVTTDVAQDFIVVAFVVEILILALNPDASAKQRVTIMFITAGMLLLLFIVNELLLNTLPSIGLKGWQDAGITLSRSTNFADSLNNLQTKALPLVISVAVAIAFAFVTSLGAILASVLYGRWTKSGVNLIKVIAFLLLAVAFQALVYIVTFPVSLWLSMGSL